MFDINCKNKLAEFEKSTHQSIIDKYSELFIFYEENLLIKIRNYTTGETLVTKPPTESEFTVEELDLIITTANDVEERARTDIKFTDGMYFSSSYKVRISSIHLKHDFELFSISCSISNLESEVKADSLPARNPANNKSIVTVSKVVSVKVIAAIF